jgi:protein ImuA
VPVITSVGGMLQTLSASCVASPDRSQNLVTGLAALDALLPGGAFARGAVHEVLSATPMPSFLLPLLLSRTAARFGRVVWCDSQRQFYPPAAAAIGLPLDHLLVLRPPSVIDEVWAVTECLRCRGVAACVAPLPKLSHVQARRLQLAAERGGGMGILLRPAGAVAWPYAAATRWMVRPITGERMLQRWSVELLHGHGGRTGQSVLVEYCRETDHVRAIEAVAHRSDQTKTATASA